MTGFKPARRHQLNPIGSGRGRLRHADLLPFGADGVVLEFDDELLVGGVPRVRVGGRKRFVPSDIPAACPVLQEDEPEPAPEVGVRRFVDFDGSGQRPNDVRRRCVGIRGVFGSERRGLYAPHAVDLDVVAAGEIGA